MQYALHTGSWTNDQINNYEELLLNAHLVLGTTLRALHMLCVSFNPHFAEETPETQKS